VWLKGQKIGSTRVASAPAQDLSLQPGEERTITQTIPIPGAHLWTPEDPFLYVAKSSTGGDAVTTRFGMREFRFDGATRRAYLNGQVYYLRGSNITLHRFFEDPLCKDLHLTCSYPGVYTADHFANVSKLQLDPAFADYMGEAFKPLGVYLNFFQPTLATGTNRNK
jgi:hypothetical protein